MSETANYEIISESVLGQELDSYECKVLSDIMKVRHVGDHEVVVSEGENDHALYLLAEGQISVTSEIDGESITVYTMNKGECAGTRAFVDRESRKATLHADGPVVVYSMKPADFESMLCAHPRIVYNVMRALFRITHQNLMRMNLESKQLVGYVSRIGHRR